MKKLIIIGAFLLPLATFGATQVVKEIKVWDYVAQIQTQNRGNLFIYKYEDKISSTTCYVLNSDEIKYGVSPSISCVK